MEDERTGGGLLTSGRKTPPLRNKILANKPQQQESRDERNEKGLKTAVLHMKTQMSRVYLADIIIIWRI